MPSSTNGDDRCTAVPALRDKDAGAVSIPVLRYPAPNSYFRAQLQRFPERCPICDKRVAEVWQDHHLKQPYTAGWLFGSWQCQATYDGRDCSRFVFVHRPCKAWHIGAGGLLYCDHGLIEHEPDPCEVVFNCQKTRALGVAEICQQVLASRKALEGTKAVEAKDNKLLMVGNLKKEIDDGE